MVPHAQSCAGRRACDTLALALATLGIGTTLGLGLGTTLGLGVGTTLGLADARHEERRGLRGAWLEAQRVREAARPTWAAEERGHRKEGGTWFLPQKGGDHVLVLLGLGSR